MKKVGIDARLYSQTGVGIYIRNIIHHLINEKTQGITFYLYILPQDIDNLPVVPTNFIIRLSPYKWHSFKEQIHFLFAIIKDKLDLMHFTYFGFPILYWRPLISTIHDITPILYKTGKASTKNRFIYEIKSLLFKLVLFCQVRKSKTIITPSFAVKKSLIQLFGKKYEHKTVTLYEGVDYKLQEIKENNALLEYYSFPFFIYVGNFYPHKNVQRLIHAFSLIKSDIKLILIGPKDYFTNQVQKEINTYKLEHKIFFYHNASVADLKFFYKHARALIHPSLSEGFGLPVLEAKFFKCPVIVSDLPVFHEITKNDGLFFNPIDCTDIKDKIIYFTQVSNFYSRNQIDPQMSFKLMTKETLLLYQQNLQD